MPDRSEPLTLDQLISALPELPALPREVYLLATSGVSYHAIATRLSISVPAVRACLVDALLSISLILEKSRSTRRTTLSVEAELSLRRRYEDLAVRRRSGGHPLFRRSLRRRLSRLVGSHEVQSFDDWLHKLGWKEPSGQWRKWTCSRTAVATIVSRVVAFGPRERCKWERDPSVPGIERRRRREMLVPSLLSICMHFALIVPLPLLSSESPKHEKAPLPPAHRSSSEDEPAMAVALSEEIVILPRRFHSSRHDVCDPNGIPEYYYFNITAGPVEERILQVTNQSRYGVMMADDALRGKTSLALQGWFRPFDAVRLLAGDAGQCATDWGDTIGVYACYGRASPFGRKNEASIRREWKPQDCTTPPPKPIAGPSLT